MDKDQAQKVAEIVASQCLAGRVRQLSRVITNLYDRALQPYGMTVNQASVLVSLLVRGEASPAELGNVLQMEKSTVSRTLDRMRTSGWVAIEGSGPGQTVRITEAGKQLMVESHDAWQDAQDRATKLLGDDGAQSLLMIMNQLRKAL